MAAVVDQWKETEISKSRKKYEKLSEKIVSWEDKKRKKAKRKLHRTEVPLLFFFLHFPLVPKTNP
jgi:uncharacterized protein (DUF342 family)